MTCSSTVSDICLCSCRMMRADDVALGISDQVEAAGAKGNKKKKSQQLGEDFIVSHIPRRSPIQGVMLKE